MFIADGLKPKVPSTIGGYEKAGCGLSGGGGATAMIGAVSSWLEPPGGDMLESVRDLAAGARRCLVDRLTVRRALVAPPRGLSSSSCSAAACSSIAIRDASHRRSSSSSTASPPDVPDESSSAVSSRSVRRMSRSRSRKRMYSIAFCSTTPLDSFCAASTPSIIVPAGIWGADESTKADDLRRCVGDCSGGSTRCASAGTSDCSVEMCCDVSDAAATADEPC